MIELANLLWNVCNKCKICCSKRVPEGFSSILSDLKARIKELIARLTQIIENSGSDDVGATASILELVINNF